MILTFSASSYDPYVETDEGLQIQAQLFQRTRKYASYSRLFNNNTQPIK